MQRERESASSRTRARESVRSRAHYRSSFLYTCGVCISESCSIKSTFVARLRAALLPLCKCKQDSVEARARGHMFAAMMTLVYLRTVRETLYICLGRRALETSTCFFYSRGTRVLQKFVWLDVKTREFFYEIMGNFWVHVVDCCCDCETFCNCWKYNLRRWFSGWLMQRIFNSRLDCRWIN